MTEAARFPRGGEYPREIQKKTSDVQATAQPVIGIPPDALQEIIARAIAQAQRPTIATRTRPMNGPTGHDLQISYKDYCLDDEVEVDRVFGGIIEVSTYEHEMRMLNQMKADGVPMDPPSWDAFMAWVNAHPKGRAGLDNQRRAYARYCGYFGIEVPRFAKKRWDTERAVEKGRREGVLRERNRFFENGPWDILRLLRANPYSDQDLNDEFHHAVMLCVLAGPRGGEPHFLRTEDMVPERRVIRNWMQTKKMTGRTITIPEPWFWDGPGPTVKFHLERTRPKLATRAKGVDDHYFLNDWGKGYSTAHTWANALRRPITKVLGYAIGPHAFRRTCATLRYTWGWNLEEVAEFLDDKPKTVDGHYIDHTWVRHVGRRNLHRRGESPPVLPYLWNLPKLLDLDVPNAKTTAENRPKVYDGQ